MSTLIALKTVYFIGDVLVAVSLARLIFFLHKTFIGSALVYLTNQLAAVADVPDVLVNASVFVKWCLGVRRTHLKLG